MSSLDSEFWNIYQGTGVESLVERASISSILVFAGLNFLFIMFILKGPNKHQSLGINLIKYESTCSSWHNGRHISLCLEIRNSNI